MCIYVCLCVCMYTCACDSVCVCVCVCVSERTREKEREREYYQSIVTIWKKMFLFIYDCLTLSKYKTIYEYFITLSVILVKQVLFADHQWMVNRYFNLFCWVQTPREVEVAYGRVLVHSQEQFVPPAVETDRHILA